MTVGKFFLEQLHVQLIEGRPLVSPARLGRNPAPGNDLRGFHGAEFLFFREMCFEPAPQEFDCDNRQIEIEIVGNDRFRLTP
jgi:hypothetical protein